MFVYHVTEPILIALHPMILNQSATRTKPPELIIYKCLSICHHLQKYIDIWTRELVNDFDSEFMLNGILHGFSLSDADISIPDIKPVEVQTYSSTADPGLTDNKYIRAIRKPKIVSALTVIDKKDGGVPIFHDCSLPQKLSPNSYVSKDPCCYQSVRDALSMVKPGWLMAKIDLKMHIVQWRNALKNTV